MAGASSSLKIAAQVEVSTCIHKGTIMPIPSNAGVPTNLAISTKVDLPREWERFIIGTTDNLVIWE